MSYPDKLNAPSICTREIVCGTLESVRILSEHGDEYSIIFTVSGRDVLVRGCLAQYEKTRFSHIVNQSVVMVCTRVDMLGISRFTCRFSSILFIN